MHISVLLTIQNRNSERLKYRCEMLIGHNQKWKLNTPQNMQAYMVSYTFCSKLANGSWLVGKTKKTLVWTLCVVLRGCLFCVCLCICGDVYVDGSLIEKSWWLEPFIKAMWRSRTASGSYNVASNPSLPQRPGPGWQPKAIFTTLLLTSLRFSFPPFFRHSPIEFFFFNETQRAIL